MKFVSTLWLASALAVTGAMPACAADYPDRPIRMIVPFAPGSATDTLGREIAAGLGARLGQPVVVETKPGAGTAIGAQQAAGSAPDGYTLFLGTNATFAVNPILYKKLPYDPQRSFRLLGSAGEMPSFLIVSSQSPYRTLADFIAQAKANPGKLTYASSGVGSTGHLVGEMLGATAGVQLLHVPFKSGPQGLTAVAAGEVDAIFYTSTAGMPLIQAGKVRPLAVSTAYRTHDLPDTPTIAESGYPDFDFTGWLALCVPAATPAPVADRIAEAFAAVSRDPAFRKKLLGMGIPIRDFAPGAFQQFVDKDRQRMVDLARQAHIQPE
ncbi:Bug family tripartite tricarboxylate transporter substrate binding protein [Bordetella bronchiseptica]|uniref:Bug family tripartite tricarboxylate transporter substrate binding protein n=1 Tax=Bordetella bronchiseptica TaxID=518 RepID=UPI00081CFC70|nr:tripartite tricarboxylate transporter substrate binding protein [Bordetella bronchiseptica]AOB27238.1 hypothetical protein BBB44_13800 [Bordetella bronchiseptica]AZW44547.1 tripartite tricarboxylate transporter substrate binding protein [Bordetella bronchiseptica]